jgi:putative membrane protein
MRLVAFQYWRRTEPPYDRVNVPWIVRLIIRWGVTMLALLAAAAAIRGVHVDGWQALLPAAAVFMIARAILRPLLIFLTCPLELLTLGLFTILINVGIFAFTAWFCGEVGVGFHVHGAWAAFLGSLVVSGVYFVFSLILRRWQRRRRWWRWRQWRYQGPPDNPDLWV